MVCMSFACSRFTGGHCWGCRSVMSCLACSLPRLVGLLGLFSSPYPSRTPKLSQWSDRPRRVGLGPQLLFLSRGSLTVRDSVVGGGLGIYSVWLPVQHVMCPLERRDAHRLQGRPDPSNACPFNYFKAECRKGRVPHGVLIIACASLLLRPRNNNYYFQGRVPHGVLIRYPVHASTVA